MFLHCSLCKFFAFVVDSKVPLGGEQFVAEPAAHKFLWRRSRVECGHALQNWSIREKLRSCAAAAPVTLGNGPESGTNKEPCRNTRQFHTSAGLLLPQKCPLPYIGRHLSFTGFPSNPFVLQLLFGSQQEKVENGNVIVNSYNLTSWKSWKPRQE